jgi:hypothetical protein
MGPSREWTYVPSAPVDKMAEEGSSLGSNRAVRLLLPGDQDPAPGALGPSPQPALIDPGPHHQLQQPGGLAERGGPGPESRGGPDPWRAGILAGDLKAWSKG